jgi:hypothetical protein
MERTILINTIYCDCRLLQILHWVNSFKLTLRDFAHEIGHTFCISRSVVVKFMSIYVESESWIPTNFSNLSNFGFLRNIYSSNDKFWVFFFKFCCKFLIFRGKFNTMSAGCRVILNENVFIVIKGRLISLIVQLDNISILNLFLFFSFFLVVEFFNFSLTDVN